MRPVVIGCRTEDFPKNQLDIFKKYQPLGMIIFAESCKKGKDIVRHVIRQFKSACPNARFFIDAEGGRVNRLKPEFGHGWRDIPSARSFADLAATDLEEAKKAIFINAQHIARDLIELGINVNCAPVADLVREDVIQNINDDGKPHATSASFYNRSFGHDPHIVTECVRAFIDGIESIGVVAVIKHMPGYGRVSADPHYAQTGMEASFKELQATDFVPFRNLNNCRAMMTGHVVYKNIDPDRCSTISSRVMNVIRHDIGFKGVIISDTIEMNSVWPEGFSKTEHDQFGMGLPLPGTLTFVTKEAFKAGCDIVMHSDCSRNFDHTIEIIEAAPVLDQEQETWMLEKMTIDRATKA